MIRDCKICGDSFNDQSPAKKAAGGLITHCPECSEEQTVKYIGLQSADGKQSQATILQFSSEKDKDNYLSFWKNNSGYHKSKSCQLGKHLSTTPAIKFSTISGFKPSNHKGKL